MQIDRKIIKYQNELNTIPLRKFKPVEMNLLFSILSQMRDKKAKVIRFSFADLQELSNYKQTARKQFINDIVSTYRKILSLSFGRLSKDGKRGSFFNLFSRFDFDYDKDYVDIQISPNAIPLLNELTQWVRFSLPEFNSLQSTYAKTAFRLFKQFRTVGRLYLDKEDFNELFDVPKSYVRNQANIDFRILKPIKLELAGIFPNLKITKKHSNHRGKPVIGYEFTWKPESNTKNDLTVFSNEQNMQNMDNITKNENLSEAEKSQATSHLTDRIYANYESPKNNEQAKPSDIFEGAKYQSQSQIQQVSSESTYQSQAQPKSAVFNQSQQSQLTNDASAIVAEMNSFVEETKDFEVVKPINNSENTSDNEQTSQNNQKESAKSYKELSIDELKAQRNRLLDSKKIVKYNGMKMPMEMRKKLAKKIDKKIWALIWQESGDMLDRFLESQGKKPPF